MEKFYVIQVLNAKEETGWVVERPDGIFITPQMMSDVKQFKSYKKAEVFIRRMKGGGDRKTQFFIRSNEYLMENKIGMVTMDKTVWYIENEDGEKLFYDAKEDGYYFDDQEVGYVCWQTEEQANHNIKIFEEDGAFGVKKMFAKAIEPKKD
jgi:hypothetical protein